MDGGGTLGASTPRMESLGYVCGLVSSEEAVTATSLRSAPRAGRCSGDGGGLAEVVEDEGCYVFCYAGGAGVV